MGIDKIRFWGRGLDRSVTHAAQRCDGTFVPSLQDGVTATRGWMYVCTYIIGADVRSMEGGIALRAHIIINNELISAVLLFHFSLVVSHQSGVRHATVFSFWKCS